MPDSHPILFFTPDPPAALWQDKPQIARRLARSHQVVYVGPELHLRSLLAQRRAGHWQVADLWRPALTHLPDGLVRFHWSPWAPLTGAPLLGRLTAALRQRRWQAVLRQLSAAPHAPPGALASSPTLKPILWLFRPGMLPYLDQFDPRLVIYHVVDEYSAYPGLTPTQAARQRELDQQLTARADLIFCTAQSLVEARQPLNSNTHYMPNAVDFDAFQQALADPASQPPRALAELARPFLGLVGGINAKLDLALLTAVARQRPGWSLALVGPIGYGLDRGELARLQTLPNVHLPGPVSPQQVPAAIAAYDVCLIPYRINEQTRHINPLKVYEYLAVGKPVVATPLPELEQFRPAIHLAGTVDAFITAVEAALAEAGDPAGHTRRQAIAAANTWDHRVQRMLGLIETALMASSR